MNSITIISAIGGLVFGFAGMILGIINLWRALDRDRVHIVLQTYVIGRPPNEHYAAIVIRNLGYMAVTIEQVGFRQKYSKTEFTRSYTSQGELPQIMQPRTSMRVELLIRDEDLSVLADIHEAFAKTACNLTFTADAKHIRSFIQSKITRLRAPKS